VAGLGRLDVPAGPVARRIEVTGGALPGVMEVRIEGEVSSGGWHRVESELSLFAAERLAGQVAVHAAVVVHEHRALVVPGPSYVGKSRLCVAAAEAGLAVLTDEYALVDPSTGLVTGWPRPVRLRRDDGTLERFDLLSDVGPVPVAVVAFVQYRASATDDWAPVSGAEAVIGLLDNTVCAQTRPDDALDAALALARNAVAVAGDRGDAVRALPALLALMG
jgi:hypothetical protein